MVTSDYFEQPPQGHPPLQKGAIACLVNLPNKIVLIISCFIYFLLEIGSYLKHVIEKAFASFT